MGAVVFDSSAILAILFKEPGSAKLSSEIRSRAVASSVILAEVQANSRGRRVSIQSLVGSDMSAALFKLVGSRNHFNCDRRKISGDLIAQTKPFGLSLGDRACLALALELSAPVYTTDKIWSNLHLGIPIHVIR